MEGKMSSWRAANAETKSAAMETATAMRVKTWTNVPNSVGSLVDSCAVNAMKMQLNIAQVVSVTSVCVLQLETRRVGRDNGKLLIDHFIQMSQTQCSYINQVSQQYTYLINTF